ncbi:hypothetical protein [Hymenobacter sp. IS2118]|uniref:hypothetical protein n=1 Tax=Hymenobacter sp. IS2118 TaxID=1505605 RepID=UPI00055790C6|nr:hypothetical protein [Hymenobacter sp. IS2118]
MPTTCLLLRVAAAWPLPGLGLLALPAGPTPHLAGYALHTALAVELRRAVGTGCSGTATVEEVTRPEGAVRGLLLDLGAADANLLPGTEIWLAG